MSVIVRVVIISFCTMFRIEASGDMLTHEILIYATGNYIKSIDLSRLEIKPSVIYSGIKDKVSVITGITKKTDSIIFGECLVYPPGCTIKELVLNINKVNILRSGRYPTYLPDRDTLFFYDRKDKQDWLFMSTLKNLGLFSIIGKAPKAKVHSNGIESSLVRPVVVINDSTIAFINENYELLLFDINSNQTINTGVSNLLPATWISKTNKLLCIDIATFKPVLLDISSKNRTSLSHSGIYSEGLDALLYSKGERYLFIVTGR